MARPRPVFNVTTDSEGRHWLEDHAYDPADRSGPYFRVEEAINDANAELDEWDRHNDPDYYDDDQEGE